MTPLELILMAAVLILGVMVVFQGVSNKKLLEIQAEAPIRETELSTQCGQLRAELDERATTIAKLEEQVNALNRLQPVKVHLRILFDGMKGSGKTTLLYRLVNPTLSDDPQMTAAAYNIEETPVPLCWVSGSGAADTTLLDLIAYDIAGERPGTVGDSLDTMREKMAQDENVGQAKGFVVLVILWDLSRSFEENAVPLSTHRLGALYDTERAKALVRRAFVFLNKCDKARMNDPDIDELRARVVKHLDDGIGGAFGTIESYVGSAQTGEGVHAFLGGVLRACNMGEHLPVPKNDGRG